jgi:hypothetical protein
VVVTGTYGLPGEGRNIFLLLNSNGDIVNESDVGFRDTLRLYDALETANHELWILGIRPADVARMLFIQRDSTDAVYLPLFQSAQDCQPKAFRALQSGGILIAGCADEQAFLMRIDAARQVLWTATDVLSQYSDVTDVIEHPDGGYLALTISNGRYHLMRFAESMAADDDFIVPRSSFIVSAFPNPFNAATTISFSLPASSRVSLEVFDILGRRVETLLNEKLTSGEHSVAFDGADLAAGLYFARLTTPNQQSVAKLLLLK